MSGIDIVGALMLGDVPLRAVVPEAQIKAGKLEDGMVLPALLARTVSRVERQKLKRVGSVRVAERIAVTIRARTYDEQRALIKLVRDACAGATGTIAGFASVAVLDAGTGPDLIGPGGSFEQTQDFRVSFDEPV